MQAIQSSFEIILSQQFHVVPVRTQRQDQWYKRTYQGWKSAHASQEPFILAPKAAQEDWLPELNAIAIRAAHTIRHLAQNTEGVSKKEQPHSQSKLFADNVLSKDVAILGPDYVSKRPLKPAMQRLSYWVKDFKADPEEHRRAIKALLATDQAVVLSHVATRDDSQIEHAAFLSTSRSRENLGWASVIDEMLQLLMALIVLKTHSETLPLDIAYDSWIPFAFARSHTTLKLQCIFSTSMNESHAHQGFQTAIDWCLRVLVNSCTLLSQCDIPNVAWEQRIIDAFLYFVGFEAWNREREGESYLGCELNTRKDGVWLKNITGLESTSEMVAGSSVISKKRVDPLSLHDPVEEETVETHEREKELENELAVVEAEEVAYGLKKSEKYRRKNSHY